MRNNEKQTKLEQHLNKNKGFGVKKESRQVSVQNKHEQRLVKLRSDYLRLKKQESQTQNQIKKITKYLRQCNIQSHTPTTSKNNSQTSTTAQKLIQPEYTIYLLQTQVTSTQNLSDTSLTDIILNRHNKVRWQTEDKSVNELMKKILKYCDYNTHNCTDTGQYNNGLECEEEGWKNYSYLNPQYLRHYQPHFVKILQQISISMPISYDL